MSSPSERLKKSPVAITPGILGLITGLALLVPIGDRLANLLDFTVGPCPVCGGTGWWKIVPDGPGWIKDGFPCIVCGGDGNIGAA